MDDRTLSADIGNLTAADNTGQPVYVKRKIAFGVDGQATDVSSIHPFPVTNLPNPNPKPPILGFINISPGYPKTFIVTDTSQLLIAANPSRVYLHLFNHSPDTVYIQYVNLAGIRQGVAIHPSCLLYLSGYDLFKGEINCISTGASTELEILEGII